MLELLKKQLARTRQELRNELDEDMIVHTYRGQEAFNKIANIKNKIKSYNGSFRNFRYEPEVF